MEAILNVGENLSLVEMDALFPNEEHDRSSTLSINTLFKAFCVIMTTYVTYHIRLVCEGREFRFRPWLAISSDSLTL